MNWPEQWAPIYTKALRRGKMRRMSTSANGGDTVGDQVRLELTPDEALVLFEFLSRFSSTSSLSIADQADERALWNLHCVLESQLTEPFRPEYRQLVQQARERLRDEPD